MEAYEKLEQELGAWAGVENVVACASGSAALLLALEGLQLPKGSAVVIPTYSMIAVARAVTLAGLRPVLVDCSPDDLNLDPGAAREALFYEDRKVGAMIVVHVYGRRADMERLWNLPGMANVRMVEDRAELHVQRLKDEVAADALCWSFFKNKVIHGQEGGATAFPGRPAAATLARSLRCMGFGIEHDYLHAPYGWNHRLSNAHAELIRASLKRFEQSVAERRALELEYDRHCPAEWRMSARECPWVYDLRIPGLTPAKQGAAVNVLRAAGVAARYGFRPMHVQPEYRHLKVYGGGHESEKAAREVLYLPLDRETVTLETCERAFDVLRHVLQ